MIKSQSAMEYLMTYGWAILIIAVVLGAIYSLGLFNGATLTPRAQPGSCQVYRPNGALTTQYISLEGACTNELPQYVAEFPTTASWVQTSSTGLPLGSSPRSMFSWIYLSSAASTNVIYGYGQYASNMFDMRISSTTIYVNVNGGQYSSGLQVPVNTWTFVGLTYSNANAIVYVNSKASSLIPTPVANTLSGTSYIGTQASPYWGFAGSLANVQVYNTSLDANSVLALYQEGIGGAPINLQSLVAWWPLNGNANDYSGDVNNGAPTNVIYSNQWLSGYTVP